MDPLVYSKITNNITNPKVLENLANQLNIDSKNIDDIENKLNEYLDKTTIKRACCLGRSGPKSNDGSTGINVKIPIPTKYNLSKDINNSLKTQYKYVDKIVYVPHELCKPEWKKYEPYCDNFINVYCTNQTQTFSNLNNQNFDHGQWKLYSKECSCYAQANPSYASAPHTCYMNGCSDGDSAVYIDPSSRGKQCDMTICTSILNASDIKVGGSSTINPTVQQNCGASIDKKETEQNNANPPQKKSFLENIKSPFSKPSEKNSANDANTPNTANTPKTANDTTAQTPSDTEIIIYGFTINKNNFFIGLGIFGIICLIIFIYIMSRGKKSSTKEEEDT